MTSREMKMLEHTEELAEIIYNFRQDKTQPKSTKKYCELSTLSRRFYHRVSHLVLVEIELKIEKERAIYNRNKFK